MVSKRIPTLLVTAILILGGLSLLGNWMRQFMGAFFVIVSILKLIDWEGFVKAYRKYDLIAKQSMVYAYAYPIIELLLGIAYLLNWNIRVTAWVTLVVMGVGAAGVLKNLLSKNPVRCACLGTRINVPLTHLTLVEDLLMAVMAIIMLL